MGRTYNEATFGESMRILKTAFSRYFKSYALDVQAGDTGALLTLLERGCIRCSSIDFQLVKNLSEEAQREIDWLAESLRKKSYTRILCNALNVFSEYRNDPGRTKHGALYYPELKLYICIGYLTPRILLKLFAEPDCEQVAVFAALAKWERKNQYLLFERCSSREEFDRHIRSFKLPFIKLQNRPAAKAEAAGVFGQSAAAAQSTQ